MFYLVRVTCMITLMSHFISFCESYFFLSVDRYGHTVLVVEESECLSIRGCQWQNETCVKIVSPEEAHPECRDAKDYCSCVLKILILADEPVRVPTVLSERRCFVVHDCLWDLFGCRIGSQVKRSRPQCDTLDGTDYCGCSLKVQLKRERDAEMGITV